MIKMVCTVWKLPELSHEDFSKHWLEKHGALVKEHAKAMGFVRYVQSHKLSSAALEEFSASRGWAQPPDGLTEVWWESEESMNAALGSPEGQRASAILQKDERNFIDATRVSAFLSVEETIFDFV